MAVSIRLRREGAKNRPYYKVVVTDKRSPRDGKFIEIVGHYDPKKPDHNSGLKLDRVEHWISRGAQPSDTVRSLIKKNSKQAAASSPEPQATAPAAQAGTPTEPVPEPVAPVPEPVASVPEPVASVPETQTAEKAE
mgnify:CR=1 FL=1